MMVYDQTQHDLWLMTELCSTYTTQLSATFCLRIIFLWVSFTQHPNFRSSNQKVTILRFFFKNSRPSDT